MLQFVFAWATSNMNSLSMEPLGAVAGTAAAVFGFMQTVGGAIIGTFIGQQFNGTLAPNALAYVVMGVLVAGLRADRREAASCSASAPSTRRACAR